VLTRCVQGEYVCEYVDLHEDWSGGWREGNWEGEGRHVGDLRGRERRAEESEAVIGGSGGQY
jgi:hypothetical protein